MNHPSQDPHGMPRPGSALRAVITGLLIDVGGSLAAGFVLTLAYGTYLIDAGATQEEALAVLNDSGTAFQLFATTVGFGFSVAGGYVCARIARRSDYTVGWMFALTTSTLGLLLSWDQHALDTNLFLMLVTIGAAMLGTRLGLSPSAPDEPPPPAGPLG